MLLSLRRLSDGFTISIVVENETESMFVLCRGGVKAADSRNTDKTREYLT